MSEKQRKIFVFAALGVAIVWAWFNIGDKTSETNTDGNSLATIQPLSPTSSLVDPTTLSKEKVTLDTLSLMNSQWGPDPFRSIITSNGQVTPMLSWKLSGIIFNSTEPMAYVNQKIVRIGDTIDNAIVFKIDKQTVTLKYNNEFITLTVSEG